MQAKKDAVCVFPASPGMQDDGGWGCRSGQIGKEMVMDELMVEKEHEVSLAMIEASAKRK
eukprot:3756670-Rhodomonas_salina.3